MAVRLLVFEPARRLVLRRRGAYAGAALPPLGGPRTLHQAPTHEEDLSTKPRCQQSIVELWAKIAAPQPWIETHRKFYYQMQAAVGEQITRVLDALRETDAYENTIVIFSSDHGDMQGAHGGFHEKWHCRLRRSPPHPVHRLQSAAAWRRTRARHPDQPRRPGPDAARVWPGSITTTPWRSCSPGTLTPARWSDATSPMRSAPQSPQLPRSPSCSPPTTRSARAPRKAQPIAGIFRPLAPWPRRSSSPTTSRPSSRRSMSTAPST